MWPFTQKQSKIEVRPLQADSDPKAGLQQSQLDLINEIREAEKTFRDIDKGIDQITGTDYRVFTITDWLVAMRQADQPYTNGYQSSWVQLFDIFANMLNDAHIQAAVDTLTEGLQSKDFYIADAEGSKLEEATEMLKAKWFYDYLGAIMNVRLWGFGLIQLRDFNPSDLSLEVSEVNRKHVRPDLGGITKQQYDQTVWREWTKEPYKTWTVYLFDDKLGKLNACVRWWIYKNEISRYWAIYNQLYGVNPVLGKTSMKDSARRNNLIKGLKNFVTNRFMVMDKDDEILQMPNSGASNQQFFENFIRMCDEQISKALLGSTMVLDNGSSRSQSQTHEDNMLRFVKSVARSAQFSVNHDLIPRLRKIGVPSSILPEGCKFVWDNSEKLTMKERAEVINLANMNYVVPTDTASEFIGIELEEIEVEAPLNVAAKQAIDDYKKKFKQ